MPFTATDTGGSMTPWDPHPSGLFQAVCYAIIDLGTQFNQLYGNEQHKCWIAWETTEKIELELDGAKTLKRRVISEFYTVSLGEKANLRAMLEGWRGKGFSEDELQGFDISNILNVNAQIQIIWKKKADNVTDRAVINSVLPATGLQPMLPENPTCYFSFEDHGKSLTENIPDGIKAMIMKSREWNETGQQNNEWQQQGTPLKDSDPWGDNEPSQEPTREPGDDQDLPF